MDKDDLAWEKSDDASEAWEISLNKAQIYRDIAGIILKYRPGEPKELHRPIRGGYNTFYRLEYKDGSSAAMRIPCEGVVKFPEEKVRYEVATMQYVASKPRFQCPRFIILGLQPKTQWDPALEDGESHVLDPDISEDKLLFLYRQMANIVLQLSALAFPRIGSLDQDENGQIRVSGRPLIRNMNSLLEFTGCPSTLLPNRTWSSSKDWYSALADMHLAQLTFQRNDAVTDEQDARDKVVARQLFRRVAADGRLICTFEVDGDYDRRSGFRLFSEDLRPSDVLVDKDLVVVGVIDWEFAYAAPAQFSFDPPWWLLLKSPEYWPGGYESWTEAYEPRLKTFLHALENEEEKMRAASRIGTSDLAVLQSKPLSSRVRKSWESKMWLVNYAARNSWAFDFIFWRYLDSRYVGPNKVGDHQARLGLLTENEVEALGLFVDMKMEETKERVLVRWDHDDAIAQLAKFMT